MHPLTQIFVNVAMLTVIVVGGFYLVSHADPAYLKISKIVECK